MGLVLVLLLSFTAVFGLCRILADMTLKESWPFWLLLAGGFVLGIWFGYTL